MSVEVVMVFKMATSWAMRAIPSVATIDDMTNRQELVGPFEEEVWSMLVAITDVGVERPINITSGCPGMRRENVLFHRTIKDNVSNSGPNATGNGELACASQKEEDVQQRNGLREGMTGKTIGSNVDKGRRGK